MEKSLQSSTGKTSYLKNQLTNYVQKKRKLCTNKNKCQKMHNKLQKTFKKRMLRPIISTGGATAATDFFHLWSNWWSNWSKRWSNHSNWWSYRFNKWSDWSNLWSNWSNLQSNRFNRWSNRWSSCWSNWWFIGSNRSNRMCQGAYIPRQVGGWDEVKT